MKLPDSRSGVLATAVRVLFFRVTREELDQLSVHHLGVGVVFTWLVGMGRYWDNPRAELLQRIGLGSVVYIIVLSLALWFVFKPFVRERWTYMRVVTFVSLTAPPAVFYAIPVEMFMDMAGAQTANM